MSIRRFWPLMLLMLASCASVPSRLAGGPFAAVTPHMAQNQDLVGSRVRWGGTIAKVVPNKAETCFEVVGRPLDGSARPEEGDKTEGRFIACSAGFYDPEVYAKGREITVIGTLQIPQLGKIGEFEYRYPRVSASEIYLWPKLENVYPYYYYPYDPFWGPGPWMMGPW